MTRRYEKKRRAEQEAETRSRIAAVAAGLHEELGPAQTTITEIARRAGVTRPTVYKHFPDERSLLEACSAHYRAQHPDPDPGAWVVIEDPDERLERTLRDLYAYYRENERMNANLMRDAETMPALGEFLDEEWRPFIEAVIEILMAGRAARGGRRRRLLAVLGLAIDFGTWRRLAGEGGLDDAEAADLMVALAREAACG